jgi:glycosyltransferase involved in cell wall biosynthesis
MERPDDPAVDSDSAAFLGSRIHNHPSRNVLMSFEVRISDQAAPPGSPVVLFPDMHRDDMASPTRQRIALIGSFRPRRCGIATFTTDIYEQLGAFHPEIDIDLYVMSALAADAPANDEPHVRAQITEQDPASYAAAAYAINRSGAGAVWLQHEFGIFGGECGEMILELVDRVAAPLIITLHTILPTPSSRQRAIMEHLVAKASRLMVMSQEGQRLLIDHYGADAQRITVIEHGAPDRPFGRQAQYRTQLGLDGRRIMMTFGLLNPGKGLETAIEALPAIVARHPDILYRIVGATHPNLVRDEGEAYRESLMALAEKLGVGDHVHWDNRFLDREELLDQLEACDIYLTPYQNAQQSTSGTLSYAVALGKAIVSTPYIHARELLGDGTGILVPRADSDAIGKAVNSLLDTPDALHALQTRSYRRGRSTIWRHFADASAALITRAILPAARPALEETNLSHRRTNHEALMLMTDSTGMFQHGIGIVPDRRHGYCLDDNARALMLINRMTTMPKAERMRHALIYASFVQHAWNPDRQSFRNFMAFNRNWCEDQGSEDSNGRALWILGDTASRGIVPELRDWASDWFTRTAPIAMNFHSPRAIAFAMLGAAARLDGEGDDPLFWRILERGGTILLSLLNTARGPDWTWFETVLSYDNPRMPEALLRAGEMLGKPEWSARALDCLRWICRQQISEKGQFRPVGSDTFGHHHESLPFDQQPVEAWAAIDACRTAHLIDGGREWREHAEIAWSWYLGRNDRNVVLGDLGTGFCRDGITAQGVNENRGAESVLAFQLAYHALTDILTSEEDNNDAGSNGTQVRADGIVHHSA